MNSTHALITPALRLTPVRVQDRSAVNIFAPGYGTAIATVSSQSNASGCMGSVLTEQIAWAMAAGPELLAALRAMIETAESPDFDGAPSDAAMQQARAAVAKADPWGAA